MLRRHLVSKSFRGASTSLFAFSGSSSPSLRFNSSSSSPFGEKDRISPEEAARLEKLARARLAEAAKSSPSPRSREIGAPPPEGEAEGDSASSTKQQSKEPAYDAAGSMSTRGNKSSASTSFSSRSRGGSGANQIPEGAPEVFKVERHRDTGGPQTTPYEKPPSASSSPAAESKSSEKKNQQQEKPASFSSSTSANTSTESSLQQPKKQPVEGSPLSAAGGTKIVFDVPEGDLPQQASYDPWSILGLKPGASAHDLRVRYHELLEQYHPDYVKDGGAGDVQKWAEVDRAYQLVTKAPSHDKRFRNLISDSQLFYYKYLPLWMSRNIDEMPRWWSWARWKLPTFWFVLASFGVIFMVGKIYAYYPRMGIAVMTSFAVDVIFHTSSFPVLCAVMITTLLFSGGNPDMAWLTSPKGFLRRPLQY